MSDSLRQTPASKSSVTNHIKLLGLVYPCPFNVCIPYRTVEEHTAVSLFLASRDGWCSFNFHSCCDNKGPTITVIESGNNIFGGFIEQSWDGGKC